MESARLEKCFVSSPSSIQNQTERDNHHLHSQVVFFYTHQRQCLIISLLVSFTTSLFLCSLLRSKPNHLRWPLTNMILVQRTTVFAKTVSLTSVSILEVSFDGSDYSRLFPTGRRNSHLLRICGRQGRSCRSWQERWPCFRR